MQRGYDSLSYLDEESYEQNKLLKQCVEIFIWEPNRKKDRCGHIGIQMPNNYISLWTESEMQKFPNISYKFKPNYEQDKKSEHHFPDAVFRFYKLDEAKLMSKYHELRESVTDCPWKSPLLFFTKNIEHCAAFVTKWFVDVGLFKDVASKKRIQHFSLNSQAYLTGSLFNNNNVNSEEMLLKKFINLKQMLTEAKRKERKYFPSTITLDEEMSYWFDRQLSQHDCAKTLVSYNKK